MTDTATENRLSLLERAWTLQRSGDMSAIVRLLAPVPVADLLAEPELGILLGFGWFHSGQGQQTLDLVHALYEPLRRGGNSSLHRRLRNLHAIVLLSRGGVEAAALMWTELMEKALASGDQLALGWAYANLAIVADIQCRWEDSLALSQRAGAVYQRLGDLRALAASHHTRGMTYRQLGLLREADKQFEHAADLLRMHSTDDHLAYTDMERGLTLYLLGDVRLGQASVQRALDTFVRVGHEAGQGDSRRVLGIFAMREGKLPEARRLLEDALERVRSAADLLTEAEVLEELAVLEKLEGNPGESARRAGEAAVIYRAMGADRRADRVEERLQEDAEGSGVAADTA